MKNHKQTDKEQIIPLQKIFGLEDYRHAERHPKSQAARTGYFKVIAQNFENNQSKKGAVDNFVDKIFPGHRETRTRVMSKKIKKSADDNDQHNDCQLF